MQSTKPLYIFDLDGTLALIEHRVHFIAAPNCTKCKGRGMLDEDENISFLCDECQGHRVQRDFKPDWHAFFAACSDDKPNRPVIEVFESLWASGVDVVIWSGRSDEARDATLSWLANNTSFIESELSPMLKMRREGDHRVDVVLKEEWLAAMAPEDRSRLHGVFEDRAQVVSMWRKNDVMCFQVASGEF